MKPILREKRIYEVNGNSNKTLRRIEKYNELKQLIYIENIGEFNTLTGECYEDVVLGDMGIDYKCTDPNTIIEYEYDDKGNEICEKCIDVSKKEKDYTTYYHSYEYDDKGNIKKCVETHKSCLFTNEYCYKYDENNRIIEINEVPTSNGIYFGLSIRFDYDELTLTQSIYLHGDKTTTIKKVYKDYINGTILEEEYRSLNLYLLPYDTDTIKTIYKYDDNNRLIQKDKYGIKSINILYPINYEYYKDTDILLKEVSSDGVVVTEYIYDNLDI